MAKRIIPYTTRTPEQLEHAKRMKEASDARIEEQKEHATYVWDYDRLSDLRKALMPY